jgi:gamma-glutamylcyclotransferase (GGCT)/AIG2-like uncharacterized protein YtfP
MTHQTTAGRRALDEKILPYLFVYGTLMSRSPHYMASRLKALAKLIGPACVPGVLYNCGYYPAGVTGADAVGVIRGEVHKLTAPRAALHMLDIYEGCSPVDPAPHLYRREVVVAKLSSRTSVRAWIYVLNRKLNGAAIIASGDYGGGRYRSRRLHRRLRA